MEGESMGSYRTDAEMIKKAIAFHGHSCPGLAIGIRASEVALREIGKATDEEVVAVVETDMCAVDAIQFLTGCTFGKGNLIHKDYGKNAFTFYRRRDGQAIRLVTRPEVFGATGQTLWRLNRKVQEEGLTEEEEKTWRTLREELTNRIMASDPSELFEMKQPKEPAPRKARMVPSLICQSCKEPVMETRTRRLYEKVYCIPCFDLLDQR
ncbi:MAG: FmdE family protein [Desulfobacterota bacterium]|nr:FmdE family protein [Thermodesulfobacteriota bacterium]